MPARKSLMLAAPALAAAVFTGVSATSASAATTDPVLSGSQSVHTSDGRYAEGSGTWTRATNDLASSLHVVSPYYFHAARGTITETIYAQTPFGPHPLWTVSHGLTACGKTDASCSSSPTQSWHDYPSVEDRQKIQQYGDFMTVTVNVQ